MKLRVSDVCVCAMLALTLGCGESEKPADPPAPGSSNPLSQSPTTASSTDATPSAADANASADDTASATASPRATATETVDANDAPTLTVTEWEHPKAGRSPFPRPGEQIDSPIPAKRLTDLDPFAAEPIDPADIPAIVSWTEAGQYVGHEITVEGEIVNLGKAGDTNFLNYHVDWRGKFYLVIFDDLAQTLPASVEQTFRGKTIRVRGVVEDHRGRPQIKILSMDQVEFVE